jgi:hypothetical protein
MSFDGNDDRQLDQALREIDSLAAENAAAQGDGTSPDLTVLLNAGDEAAAMPSGGEAGAEVVETEEQRQKRMDDLARRRELLRQRAQRQRDRGRRELERETSGAIGLVVKVSLNDRSIASHYERFAGLIDNAVYVLGRRGALVLGVERSEKLMEQAQELISAYAFMASEAQRSTDALVAEQSAAQLEWETPTYQKPTLELEVHVKSKAGAKIAAAAHQWDRAIYNLSVMSWNDTASDSQIDDARQRERNALGRVFNFMSQIVTGMRKATQPNETAVRNTRNDGGGSGPGTEVVEPGDAGERTTSSS